jgi:hypothetical protein
MSKPWSEYKQVDIETFTAPNSTKIRARPIDDQPFPTTMRVECSRKMRESQPVGTRFRIHAKETDIEGGTPFLYCHYLWDYEVLFDDH